MVCVKKLQTVFLHIDEVSKSIKKSFDQAIALRAEWREEEAIKVLESARVFAEYQFGPRIPGESYRLRGNGDRIDNWRVMTMPLCLNLMQLTSLYIDQRTSGSSDRALIHAVEARELIEPFRASIEYGELDYVLTLFFQTESNLAEIYVEKLQFEEAERHCQQSLVFARQSQGEYRTSSMFEGLKKLSALRRQQYQLSEAMELCEEAYIIVSRAHGPAHPLVQDAAAELIECLIQLERFPQAEAYARITYESMIDPRNGIDPESDGVARGMQQLAYVCSRMAGEGHEAAPDLIEEAHELIRKACRIMEELSSPNLAICLETLGEVLIARGILTDETKGIFERVLAIYVDREGGGGHGTIQSLTSLGEFHVHLASTLPIGRERIQEVQIAKALNEDYAKMVTKIYGSDSVRMLEYTKRAHDIEQIISHYEETLVGQLVAEGGGCQAI